MTSAQKRLAGVLCAALLSACGGGGNDGSQEMANQAIARNNARSQPLALTAQLAPTAASMLPGVAESVLMLAQFAVDQVHRFQAGQASTFSDACPNGGRLTLTLADRDGDGQASAGDRVTVTAAACGVALMAKSLDGSLMVDIAEPANLPPGSLLATVDIPDRLTLTDPFVFPAGVAGEVRGSFEVVWLQEFDRTSLTILPTVANDLRFVAPTYGVAVVDAVLSPALTRTLDMALDRITMAIAFDYESGSLGGRGSMRTAEPLQTLTNTYPLTGALEVTGSNGVLRIAPSPLPDSNKLKAELDTNGDSRADTSFALPWDNGVLGYLWWGGQEPPIWSARPYRIRQQDAGGGSDAGLVLRTPRDRVCPWSGDLMAIVDSSGGLLQDRASTIRLSAARSFGSQYRWTQLAGTPLRFSNPYGQSTDVSWGDEVPEGIESIPILLTVTDSDGFSGETQVRLVAADLKGATRIMYFRSEPDECLEPRVYTEMLSDFRAPPPNVSNLWFSALDRSTGNAHDWTLKMFTGDGLPLKAGSFGTTGDPTGYLWLATGQNDCSYKNVQYDILELRTDAQGRISQLAVDFRQQCGNDDAPPRSGSLRLNSSIAIPP